MADKRTMTLNLSEREMTVLGDLAKAQDLSKTAVLRQALRLYQLVQERMKAGETMSFGGDGGRVALFVGPGLSGDRQAQKALSNAELGERAVNLAEQLGATQAKLRLLSEVADEVNAAIDRQIYDEKQNWDGRCPDDLEFNLTLPHGLIRRLNEQLCHAQRADRQCALCDNTGRIYNNADPTSGMWVECECRAPSPARTIEVRLKPKEWDRFAAQTKKLGWTIREGTRQAVLEWTKQREAR